MNMANSAEARNKVWALIKDIHIALMVTQGEDGKLFGRPMGAQERDGQDRLWFFTERNSPKITQINANKNVMLSYSEPDKNNFVSITGTAEIVYDQYKIDELWSAGAEIWFPKGKTDPNIALICVSPESAEYWDAPSNAFLYAYGYIKAKLTGEQPDLGENKTVKLAS